MTRPSRALLLLDQLPQDPASGAARTSTTICEFLAASGRYDVRALATTASEKGAEVDPLRHLGMLGIDPEREVPASGRPVLRYSHRGVATTLLQSAVPDNAAWEPQHGEQFDSLFDELVADFRPDLIFTHGGHRNMLLRWYRARQAGARVVYGLWNHGYLKAGKMFEQVDAVLTPSQFLTDKYRARVGIDSTPLPTPIDPEDVVAPEREPVFITTVNPSIEKGVMFTARFADVLARERPDIPLLVIESRGTAGTLVAAGLQGGFDLREHETILVSPGVAYPRDYFATTRVLLVPSVWEEPSGRVASEALANGIPPIVSDRGGLPEECRGAGLVLPLPDDLTLESRKPVSSDAVMPWIEAVTRWVDDEAAYQAACASAAEAGQAYRPEVLRDRYVAFFDGVLGV